MSDLDKKLEDRRSTTVHINGMQIKLVTFHLDELRKLINDEVDAARAGLMTGQGWYDRFMTSFDTSLIGGVDRKTRDRAQEAAKKAAGIE